jgi:hypothetical protein
VGLSHSVRADEVGEWIGADSIVKPVTASAVDAVDERLEKRAFGGGGVTGRRVVDGHIVEVGERLQNQPPECGLLAPRGVE